jgi:transglutaminase-like putative cysteine protease
MAQLARSAASDPDFVSKARQLGSLDAVERFVRDRFVYRDEGEEIVRDPRFMLGDAGRFDGTRTVGVEGDCDDVSTLFAAFSKALGYRARFMAIRYSPTNPNFEHVFAQAYDGGIWRVLDATVQQGTTVEWIENIVLEV